MEINYGKTIISLINQVKIKFSKNIRNYCNDFDLTFPQMSVIALLNQHGEMKISDISEHMGLTNSTISGIIDRLEKTGLVRRVRYDHDRRVVKVALTDKVEEINHMFEARMEEYFIGLCSDATAEDLADIIKGLEKLNKLLDNIDESKKGEL
ncbi:MAG: MarR family transcriptional regulator [Clostridia bacterium]|nr:MarR family transcriptional regulator [Clostridia bacterium]